MHLLHHAAICVSDMDASLRFWRDGMGFDVLMDDHFEGDWPALLDAASTRMRAVFLGDRHHPDHGIVELVDIGAVPDTPDQPRPTNGFLLLSVMDDVATRLAQLAELGLGGEPKRIDAMGVDMAIVTDPNGVRVEIVGMRAVENLERIITAES